MSCDAGTPPQSLRVSTGCPVGIRWIGRTSCGGEEGGGGGRRWEEVGGGGERMGWDGKGRGAGNRVREKNAKQ